MFYKFINKNLATRLLSHPKLMLEIFSQSNQNWSWFVVDCMFVGLFSKFCQTIFCFRHLKNLLLRSKKLQVKHQKFGWKLEHMMLEEGVRFFLFIWIWLLLFVALPKILLLVFIIASVLVLFVEVWETIYLVTQLLFGNL